MLLITTHAGKKKFNILQTKLRYGVSSLNYDLCNVGIKDDASCMCGYPCENPYHYMFQCELYKKQREKLMSMIERITDPLTITINLKLLLEGSADLLVSQNIELFKHVQNYIYETKRFG